MILVVVTRTVTWLCSQFEFFLQFGNYPILKHLATRCIDRVSDVRIKFRASALVGFNVVGPIFRIYQADKTAKTENLIAEADGQVNLSDFQSALVPTLNQGRLPKEISETFNNAGVPMNARAALTTVIEGQKWTIQEGDETFNIILEPQFWAPDFDGIKFIKSLDHMWIYR